MFSHKIKGTHLNTQKYYRYLQKYKFVKLQYMPLNSSQPTCAFVTDYFLNLGSVVAPASYIAMSVEGQFIACCDAY